MSTKKVEVTGRIITITSNHKRTFKLSPVRLSRLPSASESTQEHLKFLAGEVNGGWLEPAEAEQLVRFMRMHRTEVLRDTERDKLYALKDRRLYCCNAEPYLLPAYQVLCLSAVGQLFYTDVRAKDHMHAFGAAALELQAKGANPGVKLCAAVSPDGGVGLPGPDAVTVATVLEGKNAKAYGVQEDPPEKLPELMLYVLTRLADGAHFKEVDMETGIFARVIEATEKGLNLGAGNYEELLDVAKVKDLSMGLGVEATTWLAIALLRNIFSERAVEDISNTMRDHPILEARMVFENESAQQSERALRERLAALG